MSNENNNYCKTKICCKFKLLVSNGFVKFASLSLVTIIYQLLGDFSSISAGGSRMFDSVPGSRSPAWARFCGVDQSKGYVTQDIFTDACPAGGWFNSGNDIEWKCLCTMGPFAVRFSWCDPEKPVSGMGETGFSRFTSTELSCFRVDSEVAKEGQGIKGLLSLSKWSNRYKEDGPMIWTNETGGTLMTSHDLQFLIKTQTTILRKGYSKLFALRALPKPYSYFSIVSQIMKRAVCLLPPNHNKTVGQTQETFGNIYTYEIDYLWDTNKDIPLDFKILPGCNDDNDGKIKFKLIQGKSLDHYVLPKLDVSAMHDDCRKCLGDGSPFAKLENTTEKPYEPDLDDMLTLNKEIDLQSERLATYWGDKLIGRNSSTSTNNIIENIQEFEILKKTAIMAFGACNMNHIPKAFYQFFLILFQPLISESFLKFPPPSPIEPKLHSEILKIIGTCMEQTTLYNITVDKSCPPVYDSYDMGGKMNIPIELPKEMQAIPHKHDYIMEFVWKLVTFLHYHCHSYFKEAPVLHDILQVQMDNLFPPDLLMRWANPSNSLSMLDTIFKIHLDVKTTMMNFERCVSVANKKNRYEGWLKKPINQPGKLPDKLRRKRSVFRSPSKYSKYSKAINQEETQSHKLTDWFSRPLLKFVTEEFDPVEEAAKQAEAERLSAQLLLETSTANPELGKSDIMDMKPTPSQKQIPIPGANKNSTKFPLKNIVEITNSMKSKSRISTPSENRKAERQGYQRAPSQLRKRETGPEPESNNVVFLGFPDFDPSQVVTDNTENKSTRPPANDTDTDGIVSIEWPVKTGMTNPASGGGSENNDWNDDTKITWPDTGGPNKGGDNAKITGQNHGPTTVINKITEPAEKQGKFPVGVKNERARTGTIFDIEWPEDFLPDPNMEYGSFQGPNKFACLRSISGFAVKNEKYSLKSREKCWGEIPIAADYEYDERIRI